MKKKVKISNNDDDSKILSIPICNPIDVTLDEIEKEFDAITYESV